MPTPSKKYAVPFFASKSWLSLAGTGGWQGFSHRSLALGFLGILQCGRRRIGAVVTEAIVMRYQTLGLEFAQTTGMDEEFAAVADLMGQIIGAKGLAVEGLKDPFLKGGRHKASQRHGRWRGLSRGPRPVPFLGYIHPDANSRLESDGDAFQVLHRSVKPPRQCPRSLDQCGSWGVCALLAHDTPLGADDASFADGGAYAQGP
jgi:hypothetical protein